jgi:OmcA/MtrC family decaheme c-type cytochrome
MLSGCGSDGKDGAQGPEGPPGPPGESTIPPTGLNMNITGATVKSAPVVNFSVTDQDGNPYPFLADTDLRFNIAKLMPGQLGSSSTWQNYIVRASGGTMQGSQERVRSGYPFGTLVNHNDGTYTYTFATDITAPNFASTCPAPCTDVDGNPLDISYQPSLTHRIGIQMGNSSLPLVNQTIDFVPAGGNPTLERNIVKTETCNQCHNQLRLHGTRIETKLCVTCHNPGSWTDDPVNETVDFKVMIHKIHMGESLPSVEAGGTYAIGRHDYSSVVFPADVRSAAGKNNANGGTINRVACSKCHDPNDADTPQAVAYQTPKRAACGACHDDVDFTTGANHDGGAQATDENCLQCHNPTTGGSLPGSVMRSHTIWDREYAQDCYQYDIISVTPDPVNPVPAGSPVTVTFKVTNPNPSKVLGPDQRLGDPTCSANATYNILADPPFGETASGSSRLSIDVAWPTNDPMVAWTNRDFDNADADPIGAAFVPALPVQVNALDPANVTDNGDGTFSVTATVPGTATGTGEAAIEGHPAEINPSTGTRNVRVPVKGALKYFGITDAAGGVPRRQVVAIENCNNCHTWLSLHGSNRTEEPQLCVVCHNPNDTDVDRRIDSATGLPKTNTLDGKKERSIDFKRMIHGIHAGAVEDYNGDPEHGFREKGYVVYGYSGNPTDFSDVRFPGLLQNCENCHVNDSYTLEDRSGSGGANWTQPTQDGILATSIDTSPNFTDLADFEAKLLDQSNDLNISPTAAVCSACHDEGAAQSHMEATGAALFADTQAMIDATYEACEVCHGPGKDWDVEDVHAWKR